MRVNTWLAGAVVLVALAAPGAHGYAWFWAGTDVQGEHKWSASGSSNSEDTTTNLSIGFEGVKVVAEMLGIGVGCEFMLPREFEDDDIDGEFYFIPLYVTGVVQAYESGSVVRPYFAMQFGLNMLYDGDDDYTLDDDIDLTPGQYYAFGLGVVLYDNVRLELRKSVYKGEAEWMSFEVDIRVEQYKLILGFQF